MRNVAMDVHKGKLVLCEVHGGNVVKRATGRSAHDLREHIGPGTPPARVAFEAGRSAWHLHDLLTEWGHVPIILDTTRIRSIGVGHHGRKNDKIDAEAMARALEKGYVHAAHVLSPSRRELRRLLSVRYAFVSARTQHINVVRGLAASEGMELPSCDADDFACNVRGIHWPSPSKEQVAGVFDVIEQLTRSIHDSTEQLHSVCSSDPVVALLATVPYVGLISAATYVSVIDDAGRFRDGHRVASYLGLVPSEASSSDKLRLGSITKAGNRWARVALVEAAWGLLERGAADDPLVIWGRETAARRNKFVASVAIARKLSSILWAMWKRNRPYDPTKLAAASSAGLREHAEQLAEKSESIAAQAADADQARREQQVKRARTKLRAAFNGKKTSKGRQTGAATTK